MDRSMFIEKKFPNSKLVLSVGCDPEFFTSDKDAKRYCSAHDLVPGNKEKPHPLQCGAVQADGCAIEFNIDPAKDAKAFKNNIETVLKQIRGMVPEKRYDFEFKPIISFDEFYFDKHVPDEPKELGCNPDFNAYSKTMNPRPVPKGRLRTARTASGHFHIGWTKDADINDPSHRFDCELVIRALECTIFPYLKLWDKDKERADLYGKPGAFRYKPYGVEWRTPSNAWLNHPEIWEWLYDAIVYTVQALEDGVFIPPNLWGYKPSKDRTMMHWEYVSNNIKGGSAKRATVIKYVEAICPGFPVMPELSTGDTVEEEEEKLAPLIGVVDAGWGAQQFVPVGGAHNHAIGARLEYDWLQDKWVDR